MERIKHYFIQLDLFSEPLPNNFEEVSFEKRTNIIATRVYFILLFLCIFIIALLGSLPRHSEQIDVQSPSLAQYESFPSNTLCPCTKYPTPYSTFFTSDPSFHQVCSSQMHGFLLSITAINKIHFRMMTFEVSGSVSFKHYRCSVVFLESK